MIRHLVFAGGGPRCIAFLGAVEVLNKHKMLNNVNHYWGNSAGAIFATFLSLKIPIPRIRQIFDTLDFTKFRDIELSNLVAFGSNWGLDSGDAFTTNMRVILEQAKPGLSSYTMQEMPGLHITASDLTDTKVVVLDAKTFPTMKLVDALRASTSIPFFYMPFRNPINGHMLVDGAVGCNFPWVLLPSDKDRQEALGFDFKIFDVSKEPKSLSEFIPKILNFRDSCFGAKNRGSNLENVIHFNVRGFPAWHLALQKEDRDELLNIGENTINDWLTSRAHLRTQQIPPVCALPDTPELGCPLHCKGGLLDSHECSCPQQPRDSCQGSPPVSRRPCRRWSV